MRIQSKDIASADARQKFLSNLPSHIYGTAGGNTSCVQAVADDGSQIIFDAGTGLRVLGKKSQPPKNKRYSILLSHLHWDHIQGFPFFDAIYDPESKIDIYYPVEGFEKKFQEQMKEPFFPIDFSALKNISFRQIKNQEEFKIGSVTVSSCKMSHPGGSFAYSLSEGGKKKFIYATDIELYLDAANYQNSVETFFSGAKAAAIDSQYTMREAIEKIRWGHSPFSYAVDFAAQMSIEKIFLFHHEPEHSDEELDAILRSARWYSNFVARRVVDVNLAIEGTEIDL